MVVNTFIDSCIVQLWCYIVSMTPQPFTLDQLCTLAAVPKRTVRYYIQMGLLERPVGETRGAHYLSSHLDGLLRIKQLADAGVSLERIREVLRGEPPAVPLRPRQPGSVEVRSHIWIAAGIELQVSPEQAQISPEQVRALAQAVLTAWNHIKEDNNEK
jgi:DNA-binding transcriptional MerR regulator